MTAEDVRQFLLELNRCWPSGDLERLGAFYHPDAVLLPPDLGDPIVGRTAVVDSYRNFLDAATLESFEITDLTVYAFPDQTTDQDTAMAHLKFRIRYRLYGEDYAEEGLEVYTVLNAGGRPAIAWRSQSVLDSRVVEKLDEA